MMLGPILAIAAMSAPAGYLAGSVFLEINERDEQWLPAACALFLPFGAIIAAVVLAQSALKDGEEE